MDEVAIKKARGAAPAALQITLKGTPRRVASAGPSSDGTARWDKKTGHPPGRDTSDVPGRRALPVLISSSRSQCGAYPEDIEMPAVVCKCLITKRSGAGAQALQAGRTRALQFGCACTLGEAHCSRLRVSEVWQHRVQEDYLTGVHRDREVSPTGKSSALTN